MGRESRYCCQTCRVHVYLGDASYSTWLDHVSSVEAFDALPASDDKAWWTNQNVRRVLVEHQGHQGFFWNRETLFQTREGDVVVHGRVIEDFREYRTVSLSPEDHEVIFPIGSQALFTTSESHVPFHVEIASDPWHDVRAEGDPLVYEVRFLDGPRQGQMHTVKACCLAAISLMNDDDLSERIIP